MRNPISKRFLGAAAVAAILAVCCVQAYAQGAPGGDASGKPAVGGAPPGWQTVITNEPYDSNKKKEGQPPPPPPVVKMGDKELMVNGNLNIGVGDSVGTTTGAGSFAIGYFVAEKVEVGLGLFYQIDSEIEPVLVTNNGNEEIFLEKNTSGVIGPEAFIRYNMFPPSGGNSLTYFGLEMGLQAYRTNGGKGTNDWFTRPHIGYKHFLGKSRAAFDVNFGYRAIFSSASNSVKRSDAIDFRVGLAYFFGKGR